MSRLGIVVTLLLAVSGCRAAIPDDHFACDVDSDCPPGLTCIANFCRRGGNDADHPDGRADDAAMDEDAGGTDGGDPIIDAGRTDAGDTDAGTTDAGCMPAVYGSSLYGAACYESE